MGKYEGYLTVREIAQLVSYPQKEVKGWLADGKLKAISLPKGQQGAFEGEVHAFAVHYLGHDIPPTMSSLKQRMDSLEDEVNVLKQEIADLTALLHLQAGKQEETDGAES